MSRFCSTVAAAPLEPIPSAVPNTYPSPFGAVVTADEAPGAVFVGADGGEMAGCIDGVKGADAAVTTSVCVVDAVLPSESVALTRSVCIPISLVVGVQENTPEELRLLVVRVDVLVKELKESARDMVGFVILGSTAVKETCVPTGATAELGAREAIVREGLITVIV